MAMQARQKHTQAHVCTAAPKYGLGHTNCSLGTLGCGLSLEDSRNGITQLSDRKLSSYVRKTTDLLPVSSTRFNPAEFETIHFLSWSSGRVP